MQFNAKRLCSSMAFATLAMLNLFAVAACDVLKVGVEPVTRQTPVARPTGGDSAAGVETPTPTPTVTLAAVTATLAVPPTDLCREYLPLSALQGETEGEAVATSYRCHGATIDSTGQSPARSPDLAFQRGAPIRLQLAVEDRPTAIDVRLYPGAGVSASFLRWPEELPTRIEAVGRSQPEPSTRFEYLPQAPPGPYSLVVKVTWREDVEAFFAISFMLEDAAR